MDQVEGIDLYGKKVFLPKDKLYFRPSVYGLIVKDRKILLVKARRTGKYCYPGGGMDLGETFAQALKREVGEETGLEISVGPLFDVRESIFYYNPTAKAMHAVLLYFICQVTTDDLKKDEDVIDGEAEKPRWVDMDSLRPNEFQNWQGEILEKYKQTWN